MFQNQNILFLLKYIVGANFKFKFKDPKLKILNNKKVFYNVCSYLKGDTIFELKFTCVCFSKLIKDKMQLDNESLKIEISRMKKYFLDDKKEDKNKLPFSLKDKSFLELEKIQNNIAKKNHYKFKNYLQNDESYLIKKNNDRQIILGYAARKYIENVEFSEYEYPENFEDIGNEILQRIVQDDIYARNYIFEQQGYEENHSKFSNIINKTLNNFEEIVGLTYNNCFILGRSLMILEKDIFQNTRNLLEKTSIQYLKINLKIDNAVRKFLKEIKKN